MNNNIKPESLFTKRTECPICKYANYRTLYKISYNNKYFIDFIKLEPTYKNSFYRDFNSGYLRDEFFTVAKCNECKFIFQVNILNEVGLKRLYNEWIDPEVALELHKKRNHLRVSESYSRILNIIISKFKGSSNINALDWGAGFGSFCSFAKNLGINVAALEFSIQRKSYLKKSGIPTIDIKNLEADFYHFVNLDQVLEHEPKPVELLKKIYSVLRNEGALRVSVPTCSSIEKLLKDQILSRETFEQLSPHQHINAFTNKTLKKACKIGGFKLIFEINPKPFLYAGIRDTGGLTKTLLFNVIHPFYYRIFRTTFFLRK